MTSAQTGESDIITGETVTGVAMGGGGIGDDEMARRAGLQGRIVSNLFHFAQVSDMLIAHFGEDWYRSGTISMTYLAPLYDGERMTPRSWMGCAL